MIQFTGEITAIKDQTHDVKTFTIKSPTDFNFISGQYCLVSFVDNEKFKDQRKPFTFTNSPTDKGFIELTIKKIGPFTTALFSLKIGDLLKIRGPIGKFLNFDETIKKDVVLIAGGSGITPFMSIIRYSLAKNLPNKIIMFNGNRTVDDIIFREDLEKIDDEEDNIKIINSLTRETSADWKGERGRIDKDMIKRYVNNLSKHLWYICGPPPMIKAMKAMLKELDLAEEDKRIDPWEIPGKS